MRHCGIDRGKQKASLRAQQHQSQRIGKHFNNAIHLRCVLCALYETRRGKALSHQPTHNNISCLSKKCTTAYALASVSGAASN
jgi:hypothetical protein